MSTDDSTSTTAARDEPTIEIKSWAGHSLFVSRRSSVKAALEEAVSRGADLRGADLQGADLRGAKNAELAIARTRILPDEGELIVWKKCNDGRIVKLRIPADAKRSHAAGRKCRAERAEVIEITDSAGNIVSEAVSLHDHRFKYEPGITVRPTEPFDENPWNECSSGIHFYITRLEAESHV